MDLGDELSTVRVLSDGALISSLRELLGASRRTIAEVVAHLAEVEARRLHLLAGYGSLFAYCVSRLGMSEDEACRRIDVARLAVRFPVLLRKLASGSISLSVAALLKPHLTEPNHADVLDAVSGKTISGAREVLASWFPRPDVEPTIRKLPTRKPQVPPRAPTPTLWVDSSDANPRAVAHAAIAHTAIAHAAIAHAAIAASTTKAVPTLQPTQALPRPAQSRAPETTSPTTNTEATRLEVPPAHETPPVGHAPPAHQTPPEQPPPHSPSPSTLSLRRELPSSSELPRETQATPAARSHLPPPMAIPLPRRGTPPSIEPLAPERYRVQLTAGSELKHKLELARDLLRHALPSGDLAAIIERALDVLIADTMKRRFGVTSQGNASRGVTSLSNASRDRAGHADAPGVNADLVPTPHPPHSVASPHPAPPLSKAASPITRAAAPSPDDAVAGQLELPAPSEPQPRHQRTAAPPPATTPATAPAPATAPEPVTVPAPEPAATPTPAFTTPEPVTAPPSTPPPASVIVPESAPVPESASTPEAVIMPEGVTPPEAVITPIAGRRSRHLANSVRRYVLARDGARCTWQAPDGTRCNSRAWLEHDHIIARGKGGGDDPANIRHLCKAHNRLAAELAYGRDFIARNITRRRNTNTGTSTREHQRRGPPTCLR